MLDLLGGGGIIQTSQPEPTPLPAQPTSSGGELLDLLGGLDLGPTSTGKRLTVQMKLVHISTCMMTSLYYNYQNAFRYNLCNVGLCRARGKSPFHVTGITIPRDRYRHST